MEEGKSDRGQGLAPLSVNLTSSYISQHGITYAEILLQRKLRKMSHMLQRNNGWCIASLHMPCVQAKPTDFKGEDKSVRNPFPGWSSICPDLICHR